MRGLCLIALILPPVAAAEEAPDLVRFVRGSTTIEDAVGRIGGLLGATEVQSVVFVFEQGDFGVRERLPDEPDYHAQLAEWLGKVGEWAGEREGRVRVALTGSSKPLAPDAAGALLQQARRAERVPPDKWLERLIRFTKGKPGALVYVSGLPDTRIFREERPAWDPEPVILWLARTGARLYVVMPEARFPDFLPAVEFVDLQQSWWRVPTAWNRSARRFDASWASYRSDCPSAYGVAAYARVAAATRGAYVLYPGRSMDWLDPCPFEVGLLGELVPCMPSAADAAKAAESDPALKAIAEATRRCAPLGAFDSYVSVLRREAERLPARAEAARANGDLCAAEASGLEALLRAAERGELEGVARRSLAQLRYSRFLLETCAFHGAAWADATAEAEEFAKRGEGREAYQQTELRVTLWSKDLRLRDLVASVAGYPRGEEDEVRARSTKKRIAELPPLLRDRAARVIAAADEVMKHEGLSPWGWMVYYSDFVTFAPDWTGSLKADRRRPGSEAAENETPSEPPAAPGSGGTGPKTGG